MKDYYKILNVKPTATDDEIKRSYRMLAKKYHPDVNPGNASAAEKFADINEAHDTLSDSKKRAEYDKKVKEAAAPKPRPEDIIARQRAAAQAAARQAAMRNTARDPMGAAGMSMAQRMAAAQAQQFQAAAAQAAAAQAQQYQAQVASLEKKAYNNGYERGTSDARNAANKEISKLNDEIKRLKQENSSLTRQLTETEHDRSDLEQELFNRDRELSQAMTQVEEMNKRGQRKPGGPATVEAGGKQLEEAKAQIRKLEQERAQAERNYRAQIELQQEKRRQLQEQIDALTAEVEELRAENEQWQQYAKSEEFISNAEQRLLEWEQKQKADKKLAKPTIYGTLGVLIWATDAEIKDAYEKLKKRYEGKTDAASADKLKKIDEAYEVLSDTKQRNEYNEYIGISPERIKEERKLIADNAKLEEEYRSQLESKEFWERFDEINFNAETGDADSQNLLGEMYYYGDEIEQDLELAVYWFKEAAKQKHADAMYNLGVCFMNGEGTDRNETTGLGFIRQAAKLGSKPAMDFVKGNK